MRRAGSGSVVSFSSRVPALSLVSICALALVGGAQGLPPDFQETIVFSGLDTPTAVRFAPDGRVFVAQKNGVIYTYDNVADTTPTVFADLSTQVYDAWDRGLTGLAIDPGFPAAPYVYVLYTFDAAIGGTPPLWSDDCPDPPGFTNLGCAVSGRLSRLEAFGDVMTGPEVVLIEDWCQQYPSHSVGDLHFGMDGALYATAGDGASFGFVDHGQMPSNCTDPPGEGGALRSQDIATSGDPLGLSGTLIRVDPMTGLALADNPLFGGAVPDDDRIVAYGLRNPFRFTVRPGTDEIWIGDVGWNEWEEINRVPDPTDALVENLGWPCYEGIAPQSAYDSADYPICESLYAAGTATAPYYDYPHPGNSSVSGLAFYAGGFYPPEYDGALFFADYSQRWIQVMFSDVSGDPDPGNILSFRMEVSSVDLQIGPGGDLFYVELVSGEVRRIEFFVNNTPPNAVLSVDVAVGPSPLTVQFDGTGSTDLDVGDVLSYAWDLDGDGEFDDSTSASPQWTYTDSGRLSPSLEVSDLRGTTDVASLAITIDNAPPTAKILTPVEPFTWKVGDTVSFAGEAVDPDTGALPASALDWDINLLHCSHDDPEECHQHFIQEFDGAASGDFVAIDHEYPSFLELRLSTTDEGVQDWWSPAWSTRRTLRFDNQGQGGLMDFPVLVRLDPTRIDYGVADQAGADLRFVASDASTMLPYEIESWDPNGISEIWVHVPSIGAGSTSDFIWMYYGNPTAVDAQFPKLVWVGHAGVWHMDGSLADSTSNLNHGTDAGTTSAAGRIGQARAFDGVDDFIDLGSAPGLSLGGDLTLEAWIQIADPDQMGQPRILSKKTLASGPAGYELTYSPADNHLSGIGSGADHARADGVDLDTGWHHVAAVFSGAQGTLFVDGVDQTTDATVAPVVGDPQALVFGRSAGGGEHFFGNLDELRLSQGARSADWLAAQYLSMSDAFITYGTARTPGHLTHTTVMELQPQTSELTLCTIPAGFELVLYTEIEASPSTHEVLVNALATVSAPTPQFRNGAAYEFVSWSDGGSPTHEVVMTEADQVLTAVFRAVKVRPTPTQPVRAAPGAAPGR